MIVPRAAVKVTPFLSETAAALATSPPNLRGTRVLTRYPSPVAPRATEKLVPPTSLSRIRHRAALNRKNRKAHMKLTATGRGDRETRRP